MKASQRLNQEYINELYASAESEFGLASIQRSPAEQKIVDALVKANLPPFLYGSDIALWLGVNKAVFDVVLREIYAHYKKWEIDKGGKNPAEKRILRVPAPVLNQWQRAIKLHILDITPPSDAAHAYFKGRGPSTAAKQHEGKAYLWTFDLKDFFGSVTFAQVLETFESMGYPKNAASALAGLTALGDGGLPQGSCSSPALSNLVLRPLDKELLALSARHKVTFTRYADDFSFSRDRAFSKTFQRAVEKLIDKSGFEIHPRKSRLRGPLCSRQVSGLVINTKPAIPREQRRNIRALFNRVSQSPKTYAKEHPRLLGLATWVKTHHPEEGAKYLAVVKKLKE